MQHRDLMRVYNKSEVMEIMRKNKSVYRAELARMTGLSMPTIMKITDEFIRNGLIADVGKGVSSGGKPPMLLELIPEARLFIGMDISGAMFKCIIMDLRGGVVYRRVRVKGELDKKENIIDSIIEFIEATVSESGIDENKLSGIGIGVPGLVETQEGRVITSIDYNWKNVDVRTPLQKHFKLPVYVENSSKVMAIGEKWFGNGDDSDNFALVTVGRGIGAALIMNGEIYKGFYNMSGEVGHMVIDPNGPLCKCGKRGCLETLASGNAIANQARQLVDVSGGSIMLEMVHGDKSKIESDVVFKAAAKGDLLAQRIVDNVIDSLCIGLGNLISLIDCQLIVLTGCVVKDNEYLLERVKSRINETRSLYYGKMPVDVKLSTMGEEAAVVGAATLPLRNLVVSGDLQLY
ncbi:ROK family protein [Lachnospiraceae bacterium ASD3451]|uniref:ROK family protein n=1 Tax=Diplocloster agilis TaxID=2850323 RepID=UPI001DA4A064|nr:ROK family protein [Diplocloster agilis]MBU9742869.1 ROK family protein [Diplocloster agilis]